jgi:GxxExxY protein
MTKTYLKDLVYRVNGAAIEVHRQLGPGLLESIYQKCLAEELKDRQIAHEINLRVPVKYKNKLIGTGLRCDVLIEKTLVVELKAVEYVLPVHDAQILSYMKLLNVPIGLLINFHVDHIFSKGQRTFVNELFRNLPD